jgi:type IV pilus assembly protein PilB
MRLPVAPQELKRRLVGEGLIDPDRFDVLEKEAERNDQNLIDTLVGARIADYGYLARVVADILGVEIASLGSRIIDDQTVKKISEETARERHVVLFGTEEDGTIDAAMLEPNDLETLEYLRGKLGVAIKPFLATQDDLNRGFVIYGSQSNEKFESLIQENVRESLNRGIAAEGEVDFPIVAIVDNVLSFAISSRASDIHIEALEEETLVRYRVDGILREIIRVPKAVHAGIVARIKILSGLKIDEHYRPQDGRFRHTIAGQVVDIRVSVMPTYYGEKIVMRILESAARPLSLEELGMLPDSTAAITANLKKAYGMIIICGPTGSGKSTTLYAMMSIVNRPNVNVVTIEDPVEYNMRFANQSQINPQAGITFASGLRALLRQDPNVIMVGEIRDDETANIAVQAALTGHLLLSSLHTNDAPSAIPRLFDLGVPPFLVSSTLNLVFAQRLVRKICTSCIYSEELSADMRATLALQIKETGSNPNTPIPSLIYKGKGCPVCGGSGYRGRLGIFEVLEVSEKVKEAINTPQFDLSNLTAVARAEGMRTMFEDGLKKVELGQTTVEEVLRVIRE